MWLDKKKLVNVLDVLKGRTTPVVTVDGMRHRVLGTPLDEVPDGHEVAYFGLGCFWGAEKVFWGVPGVTTTLVGYQGGVTPNPTYREVCSGRTNHAEVVKVVYDPAVVSYADLVRVFFEHHDPTQGMRQGNDVGTQYRSAIHATSPEQISTALRVRDLLQPALTRAGYGPITTEIADAGTFYPAEDYHQQYLDANPDGYDCHVRTGVACPIP
jgi:peptide-methionine (S)-S-oxide reductase